MNIDEAVRHLRSDSQHLGLVRDSYIGEDTLEAAERFLGSAEFAEVRDLLGERIQGGLILDLGAGNGIASFAIAKCGARLVYAVEPDPSEEVGRGAILRLRGGLPIEIVNAFGEQLPLPDESVDVVYARQVLHHTRNLPKVLSECARVLRSGGVLIACREHVADDVEQLEIFLDRHPLHRLTGGESAFPLPAYLNAITGTDLELVQVLGPWDTVINAFPAVRSRAELEHYPRILLERRFGRLGALASLFPGIKALAWARLRRPVPGRMYSFVAIKR